MKLNLLNRRVHYWITPFLALPILIILISGSLLQVKKQWTWVQPSEQRGTGSEPVIDFPQMMRSLREQTDLEVEDWRAVHRIDVRPSKGLAKVSLKSGWEVQIDLGTGRVLQTAIRRSDWIETLHDGSFFAGDWTKLGVFLPTALGLLLLWGTGMWMFLLPVIAKRRKKKRLTASQAT